MTKGKSLKSSNLIVIRRASILILIIIIITRVTIIVLVLRCLWRRKGRLYDATKASLSLCNTTDTGVHLIQLSSECIKVSIHTLRLRYDYLKGHTTRGSRKSGGRWSRRGWRSRHLGSWPLRLKLGLASSNGCTANGTHDREMSRI